MNVVSISTEGDNDTSVSIDSVNVVSISAEGDNDTSVSIDGVNVVSISAEGDNDTSVMPACHLLEYLLAWISNGSGSFFTTTPPTIMCIICGGG